MSNAIPTDAASGATLNGSGWLTDFLKTGIAGYVAVQTVKNQNRAPGTVTTEEIPRVASPSPVSSLSPKTLYIVGGILVTVLLAVLFMGRRK